MTATEIAAARKWISRLQGELNALGLDDDPRNLSKRKVTEGILEEIARVERLIRREVAANRLEVSP